MKKTPLVHLIESRIEELEEDLSIRIKGKGNRSYCSLIASTLRFNKVILERLSPRKTPFYQNKKKKY